MTAQIEAVVSDMGVHAAKTGMLANAAIVEAVAAAVGRSRDSVPCRRSGDRRQQRRSLLDDEGLLAMKNELLSRAHAVTPNIPEAEMLSGVAIRTDEDRREAARRIFALGPVYVVITGGHSSSDRIIDLVYDGDVFTDYAVDRVAGRHTHGTGCAFSAALASHLAIGRSLHEAVPLAQEYVAGRHSSRAGARPRRGTDAPLLASR